MNLNKKEIILILLSLLLILAINSQVLARTVVINEIMASNKSAYQDSDSDFDDWLELKNIGENPVNLAGFFLSDKKDKLTRWQFAANEDIIIQPGDYIIIWADDEVDEKGFHTNFKLSSSGETVTLTEPDGNTVVDQIRYPEIMTDVSYGRNFNNSSKMVYFIFPTPEKENDFGLSSYYWSEKLNFMKNNRLIASLLVIFFLIILMLLISYYRKNKELQISKNKYKNLFLKSPVGLLICDLEGNILDVNTEMLKLLGASDKELVKLINLNDVLIVKDVWINEFLLSNNREVTEGEIEFTTRWNKDVYLKYKVEIIQFLNSGSEVIIAVNDISREKAIEKELSYLSFNDGMTGLYNRRYFENELERLNQSRNLPISIIIGDLDGLKFINDHFGHKTGDKYIIKLAEIMKNSFREEDIAARIGGDEFAVILPETDSQKAEEIAARLKEKCSKHDGYKHFGISVGYATKNEYFENLDDIFIKADKDLYKDKKAR